VLVHIGMASVSLGRRNDAGYTAKEEATDFGPFTQDKTWSMVALQDLIFYKPDQPNAHTLMFSFTQLLHMSGHSRFCTAAPPDGGSLRPEACRSFVD